jgi:hypothetical protein
MSTIQRVFAAIAVLGLAGCGGGGGGEGGGDTSIGGTSALAPTISTQPAAATVADGANARFSTAAAGDAPLTYQWRRNGTDLVDGSGVMGATSAALTLAAPYAFNASQISVRVSNAAGNAVSNSALLTVTPVAPTITTQPANASVIFGAPATFSVAISGGTAAITYQWKRNGTAIMGATDSTYTIPATATLDDSAMFAVDISNPAGTLSSVPAILTVTPAGPGVNFNVNTIDDRLDDDTGDGVCHTSVNTCSLRAAIMQANHLTVPLTRINVPAGIYTLTRPPTGTDDESSGNLNLSTPIVAAATIVISGAGAGTTVIDANQIDSAMEIETGRIVTLRGITLRNGRTAPSRSGGGIFNLGSLTLSECVIEGGRTNGAGGGIANSGTLQVIRSTIRSNTAAFGGGLFLVGPTTVRDSTIAGNHADSGGGIYNDRSVYVVNSTVSQNTADTDGGGIGNYGGTIGDPKLKATAALYNTTVTDNDADHDRDERGGIGGGVINKAGSRFIVVNTLIVRNTLVDSPIYDDCEGNLELYGIDIFSYDAKLFTGTGSCTFSANANNARAFDPGEFAIEMDTTLRANGGPTLTVALLRDSHAIDFGLECVDEKGDLLTTDQRGAPRIAGAQCDVGAYEFDSLVP